MVAFVAIGGVPIDILYDRMKTAVTGEYNEGHISTRSPIALARHTASCQSLPPLSERPFSYIRQDFFLARSFRILETLRGLTPYEHVYQVWNASGSTRHTHIPGPYT